MKLPSGFWRLLLITTIFIISMPSQASKPLWTFNPLTPTNITLTQGNITTIKYIITNQSKRTHTLSMTPIAGITQITTTGNCSNPFTLAFQQSCVLTLQVTANDLQNDIDQGPLVCNSHSRLQCYQPSQVNSLNITRSAGTFLAIADIHLDQDTTTITYGEDTGTALFASTQTELAQVISEQDPGFLIYLGDSPAHTQPNRASNIQLVLQALSGGVTSTPLFYVYGNNDSYNLGPNPTVNYGPFSQNGVNLFSLDPSAPWPALNVTNCPASTACINSNASPDMAYAQIYGFYSAYPLGSNTPLRLISLNSDIFSYQYTEPLPVQQAEAQFEMDWLAAQLQDAQGKNEQVYIAMHIPVGNGSFAPLHPDYWNQTIVLNGNSTPSLAGLTLRNAFLSLINSYKNTIRSVISGHTHTEEFRVLYWGQTNYYPTLLNVGLPGITPLRGNNPGMQLYYYDTAFNLIDAITYYTTPQGLTWLTFSFRNDYACPPHSTMYTCVLNQLIPYLAKGSPSVTQYMTNFSVRSPFFTPEPVTTWNTILNTIQVYPVS